MSTTPSATQKAMRRQRAVEMRIGGATFEQIGRALGTSRASAYKLVMRTLADTRAQTADDSEHLRDLANARIENAIQRINPEVEKGNLGAVDKLVKLLDRQARLNGLDAPTKIAPQLPAGMMPPGTGNADVGELPDGVIVGGFMAIVPAKVATPEAWAAKYSPTKITETPAE